MVNNLALIPETGQVSPGLFYKIMANVAVSRQDCALAFFKEKNKRIIFFQRGEPIGCLSNILGETIVSFLQQKKRITPAQVKVCLEASGSQQDLLFAEALLSKGILDPPTLTQLMKDLLRQRIINALKEENGEYRVGPTQKLPFTVTSIDSSLLKLLLDNLLETDKYLKKPEEIEDDSVPLLASVGGTSIESYGVSAKDTAILRQVNGISSLSEIVSKTKGNADYICRLLNALEVMGLLRLEKGRVKPPKEEKVIPAKAEKVAAVKEEKVVSAKEVQEAKVAKEEKPEAKPQKKIDKAAGTKIASTIEEHEQRIEGQNYYAVLGVTEEASESEIKSAYFNLVKVLHPDRLPKDIDSELKKRGEELFAQISTAHDVLSDPNKAEEYRSALQLEKDGVTDDTAMKALQSEVEFQKAQVLIRKGDFAQAETVLRTAIELYDKEPEYYIELGWSIYRLCKKQGQTGKIAEATKTIKQGLEMNDKLFQGHFYLGQIAKIEGEMEMASHYFNKVVQLNPNHHEANRELRIMAKSKGKSSAKGIKSLFKRG